MDNENIVTIDIIVITCIFHSCSALPALPTVLSVKHASGGDWLIPLKKLPGWIELTNHRQKHA